MRGIFCYAVANTNEEYRKVVKNRMTLFVLMALAGALAIAAPLLLDHFWKNDIKEGLFDIYIGFGSGLLAISVIFWFMHWRLLRNENKLKEERIKSNDERLVEIGNRSLRFASNMMIASMYITTLIVGLYNTILFIILLINMCVLLLAYAGAYRYYLRKM